MERILVVDDNLDICRTLRDDLNEVGYEAEFVTNGYDAISYLEKHRVDLMLLDLKMQGKDGFEVLKDIKTNNIKTKVIVLTAYADVKSAIDSAKLGASDFISKPYDFDELIITIRRVLQRENDS